MKYTFTTESGKNKHRVRIFAASVNLGYDLGIRKRYI